MLYGDGARIFSAGDDAPAGTYYRIDADIDRLVILTEAASLPPSFDGTVALYQRLIEASQPSPRAICPSTGQSTRRKLSCATA